MRSTMWTYPFFAARRFHSTARPRRLAWLAESATGLRMFGSGRIWENDAVPVDGGTMRTLLLPPLIAATVGLVQAATPAIRTINLDVPGAFEALERDNPEH